MPSKERVIIFDILRIAGIGMVVACHVAATNNYSGFGGSFLYGVDWNKWLGLIFFLDIGNIGVLLFLCISGAVLELNKPRITTLSEYLRYELHRLLRIYPAYWMSLLFAIMLFLNSSRTNLGNLFWQFSGFNAFVIAWGGPLNIVGWSIGLFVVMYLLFPFISRAINSHPYSALICLLIISLLSTFYINSIAMSGNAPYWMHLGDMPHLIVFTRWFPLCNLFYFSLGVFIVRQSWYPKYTDKTGIISYFGELSFFIFLFHFPIRIISKTNILLYLMYVFALAMVAMMVDSKLHEYLKLAGRRLENYHKSDPG